MICDPSWKIHLNTALTPEGWEILARSTPVSGQISPAPKPKHVRNHSGITGASQLMAESSMAIVPGRGTLCFRPLPVKVNGRIQKNFFAKVNKITPLMELVASRGYDHYDRLAQVSASRYAHYLPCPFAAGIFLRDRKE